MLFTVEQVFVGRDKMRAPLKMPVWEATLSPHPPPPPKKINPIKTEAYNPEASKFSLSVKNHVGFFSCPIRSKEIFLPSHEVIWN